ncbi:hypothetical protein [Trichocoleus sp. FACHB-90]|nr:hypothetical protein [Trichocoleus sp. FACHB-90]
MSIEQAIAHLWLQAVNLSISCNSHLNMAHHRKYPLPMLDTL